jgi:hypothetical protein
MWTWARGPAVQLVHEFTITALSKEVLPTVSRSRRVQMRKTIGCSRPGFGKAIPVPDLSGLKLVQNAAAAHDRSGTIERRASFALRFNTAQASLEVF